MALERWLDVKDPLNAAFRLPPHVQSEHVARHRVDELIELLGLQAYRSKFVGELSTGSRRVVDLGCVLAHEPSVVLLDEPSSGIAQREAEALGPLLLRIRDTLDASLVVIEHDMSLISSISDRLVALDQGAVVTEGPPAEVLAHPAGGRVLPRRRRRRHRALRRRPLHSRLHEVPAMTPRTATPPPRASLLARFGPLAAVLVAIGLVAVLASTGREGESVDTAGPSSEVGSSTSQLPITWAEAEEAGTTESVAWVDGCDPETGRMMLPSNYAPPCVAPVPG